MIIGIIWQRGLKWYGIYNLALVVCGEFLAPLSLNQQFCSLQIVLQQNGVAPSNDLIDLPFVLSAYNVTLLSFLGGQLTLHSPTLLWLGEDAYMSHRIQVCQIFLMFIRLFIQIGGVVAIIKVNCQ